MENLNVILILCLYDDNEWKHVRNVALWMNVYRPHRIIIIITFFSLVRPNKIQCGLLAHLLATQKKHLPILVLSSLHVVTYIILMSSCMDNEGKCVAKINFGIYTYIHRNLRTLELARLFPIALAPHYYP